MHRRLHILATFIPSILPKKRSNWTGRDDNFKLDWPNHIIIKSTPLKSSNYSAIKPNLLPTSKNATHLDHGLHESLIKFLLGASKLRNQCFSLWGSE